MKILIGVVFILGLAGSIVLFLIGKAPEAIGLFIGSVVPLIIATMVGYHQYLSAKEARIPVASLKIEEQDDSPMPSWCSVILHNHCNQTISATCYPSATLCGQPAEFENPIPIEPIEIRPSEHKFIYGFYVWDTIVRNTDYGDHDDWFRDEVSRPIHAIDRMTVRANTDAQNAKDLFRFKISIQYRGLITGVEGKPISKEYYYDFLRREMIDTSLSEA